MKEQVYACFLTLSLPLSPSLSARLRSSKPFAPPPPPTGPGNASHGVQRAADLPVCWHFAVGIPRCVGDAMNHRPCCKVPAATQALPIHFLFVVPRLTRHFVRLHELLKAGQWCGRRRDGDGMGPQPVLTAPAAPSLVRWYIYGTYWLRCRRRASSTIFNSERMDLLGNGLATL